MGPSNQIIFLLGLIDSNWIELNQMELNQIECQASFTLAHLLCNVQRYSTVQKF